MERNYKLISQYEKSVKHEKSPSQMHYDGCIKPRFKSNDVAKKFTSKKSVYDNEIRQGASEPFGYNIEFNQDKKNQAGSINPMGKPNVSCTGHEW